MAIGLIELKAFDGIASDSRFPPQLIYCGASLVVGDVEGC
jgi:hypothetical protein